MITFRRLGKLGRFGNQLFQYAGTRMYAESNGFEFAFPKWAGDDVFELRHLTLGLRHSFLPTIQLADLQSTSWYERTLSPFGLWQRSSMEKLYAQPRDNVNLYGYLQDPVSLKKLAENKQKVLGWFRFKKELDELLRHATEKYRPWLGVHIRRGDLVKRGITVPTGQYVELIKELGRERNVYVATDDPSVVKEFSEFCPFAVRHLDFNLPAWAVDFWMLANADLVLGGGSTFSWWAAYLGNKNAYYSPPLTHLWPKGCVPKLEKIEI